MIEVRNVSKYYGAHAAVRSLSFKVAQGEIVGLLGLNGAGKTTMLRLLSGLLAPTGGSVHIGGVELADHSRGVRGRIGFLPETPPLYPEMSVRSFLRFVARINGLRKDLDPALDAALGATDLLGVQHERIATLSHGYHRRIGIAQTVVHSPHLILLDEPTNGLDPLQVVQMRKLIRGLAGKHTVLVSSHLLGEIHALCDRILVLDEGRIAAEGTEEELRRRVVNQTHVELEVLGARTALHSALERHPGVQAFRITDTPQNSLQARCELTTDIRASLVRTLVEAGLEVLALEREHLPLEGIFLQLMGKRHAEAAAKLQADAREGGPR